MSEAEIRAFFAKLREMIDKPDDEPSEAEARELMRQGVAIVELIVLKLASL